MTGDMLPADHPEAIEEAARILEGGGLVAVPTETVYGLAADATNAAAVARIYEAKGRPSHNPLIAHVESLAMAERFGALGERGRALTQAFWPGPLTLVVPHRGGLVDAVTAGLPTVALRRPVGIMAQLAERLGRPLAAPSANRSGRVSPTTAAHVAEDLSDRVDLILDGGPCPVGVESTIVRVDPLALLREGGVTRVEIETVLGELVPDADGSKVEAPGMLASHYAPDAPVRLDAREAREGEALLGFDAVSGDLNLSPTGDLAEAARNLYAMLKALDARAARIAVAPIPREGLGMAINDRLRRAAAPRE